MSPLQAGECSLGRIRRVIIENVRPEIDAGRFPIKRTLGEEVEVLADVFADGHDELSVRLIYRAASEADWHSVPMKHMGNDLWRGCFSVRAQEPYVYTVEAWPDPFRTWANDLVKRNDAAQELTLQFLIGTEMVLAAAARADGAVADRLRQAAVQLKKFHDSEPKKAYEIAENIQLGEMVAGLADPDTTTRYEKELRVEVDRERARFSAWYEMFPRSCTDDARRHGTFQDCLRRLDYVASMGFDILYLPPIHPIGEIERRGKNNSPTPGPDDVGSPWAIGSVLGGHKSIHPQLGTLDDFKRLLSEARQRGLEVALDLAFQCAPDHPYVREHKEWFCVRPDGSVQYAENPPKKYQDIYPLNFEGKGAQELAEELKSIVLYWIEQGVRIFRVDNPHTKPFAFWEWLIAEVRREYPDALFLSEAFTRPKIMYRLAKLGFTQSYTYFAWRNTKLELTQYFTELTRTNVREYFRANLWPNTPDILTESFQLGGRPAFMIRLVLAATLGANYGIYGPAFEHFENRPLHSGSEEYLDSEKYQLRVWDLERPDSLKDLISRINRIRKDNPALQSDKSLRFHDVDNDQLIAYSKNDEKLDNIILVVVNLDPLRKHSGIVDVPIELFQLDPDKEFQVRDLLTGESYRWRGVRNYVELAPGARPAHIFCVRRLV